MGELETKSVAESNGQPRPHRGLKIILFACVWVGGLVATDPTLKLWPFIYMFPLGLPAFFVAPEHRQSNGLAVMIAAWVLYVAQGVFYFRAKSGRTMFLLLAGLAVLLVFNAAGCREMNNTH